MKKLAQTLTSLLLLLTLSPLSSTAQEVCEGSNCTVTFQYTGSFQQWSPPAGAVSLSFEVFGASGARGGAGGAVSGNLIGSFETLYIFVGGAGRQGNSAAGGFNGGGRAGGDRGNEGSGGGASDIRLSLELTDRIVVAGGGGGGGGYSGASGAAGGGLVAPSGASGQGGGGGGGTQTTGGVAGRANGGSAAGEGSFGSGGHGGTSGNAGGGGGGGGWFGGGGGGGDDDTCCDDGGGGGGGSSHASESHTRNANHQVGINTGNGRVVISYKLLPSVINFEAQQSTSYSAEVSLEMSMDILNLSTDDIVVSDGCQLSSLLVDGTLASFSLQGCPTGEVVITLKSNSVGAESLGPPSDVSTAFDFDGEPPSFAWSESAAAYSSSAVTLSFSVSQSVTVLSTESFLVSGCEFELVDSALSLYNCLEGEVTAGLRPLELSDEWGNLGPLESTTKSFVIDQSGPEVEASDVLISGADTFSYLVTLSFSEPALVSSESFTLQVDADCQPDVTIATSSATLSFECGYASGSWTLAAFALGDSLGNLGPTQEVVVSFSNVEPEPTIEPEPETSPQPAPIPVPVDPVPVPIPEPTPEPEVVAAPDPEPESEPLVISESEEVSSESSTVSTVTESPTVSEEVIDAELEQLLAEVVGEAQQAPEVPGEAQVSNPPDNITPFSQSVTASVIAKQVPDDPEPTAEPVLGEELIFEEEKGLPWWPAVLLALLGIAGFGTWRASGR